MSYTKIAKNLYVSGIRPLQTEPFPDDVDRVVSVCQSVATEHVNVPYDQFMLADGRLSQAMWGGSIEYDVFAEAVDHCLEQLYFGDTILVHCHVGKSRSVAVCATLLALERGWDYQTSFAHIKERRPIAGPHRIMVGHAKRRIGE